METLFGITLPSTCWLLGVKLFYIQFHSHVTTVSVSVSLAWVYYLLSAVRRPSSSLSLSALGRSGRQPIYDRRRASWRKGVCAVHRIPGVIQHGHGRLRREQDESRIQYVPIGRSWPPNDHAFHPIPRQLPRAYRSSHLLFRRERTRLVHLTVHGHPCLPVYFPDRAAPFSHTQSGAAQIRRDRSPVGQNYALV